jgi:endonuclease/exonuclease/phosphatase family metal-dependent hydrolase
MVTDPARRAACIAAFAALSLAAACARPPPRVASAGIAVDTVRLLAYNIHHGEGMDDAVDLKRIAAQIRDIDPDLVALQEVDSATARTGRVDQAAELGRLTRLQPVFGRFIAYQGGAYGMALLSRWPVVTSENVVLPDGEEPRTALSATLRSPDTGQQVRFVGIHFYRSGEERLAQSTRLQRHLRGHDLPTILAGDFNSRPDSRVMSQLAENWLVVPKGEDHYSFPSYAPDEEIDFILLRPAGAFRVIDQRLLDEPIASDHRPLVADVILLRRTEPD